ncbi:Fc.00g005360.m01.CDS01 [Cosmosporella sp. VM-42]
MPRYFEYQRDTDPSAPIAVLAWRLVVARLEERHKLLDMAMELVGTLESCEPGTLERNFYWALYWQVLDFIGEVLVVLEEIRE